MKVSVKKIPRKEDEQVVLECVEMTRDFEEIREYVLMKGDAVTGYIDTSAYQLRLSEILYFEAVGEQVFAYTEKELYLVRMRLYEVEEAFRDKMFIRCSKSVVVNIMQIESFRPALDSRFLIRMKNGEEVIASRSYAKDLKRRILAQ